MPSDDFYSFENLWQQYRACRRTKRNTLNALAFEIDAEAKLLALQRELRTHTYRPGCSICFITDGPKPREVFAADFRDRVMHHLLVSYQEKVFERCFIHDSYACRKGKGTLAASDRLMEFLRRVTANGRRPAWALTLDVASFFPSIHKHTLYDLIARRIKNPEILWLTRVLLFHDPTIDYRFRTLDGHTAAPGQTGYPISAQKSLFGKGNERGLPIGNLTSQFWGNVYLDALDQFVKRILKCRYYLRYVDDMVLLSEDSVELLHWRAEIEHFLHQRLALSLKAPTNASVAVKRGVVFVGWRTWWDHRLARRQTVGKLHRVLHHFERHAVRSVFGGTAWRIDLPGSRRRVYSAHSLGDKDADQEMCVDRLRTTIAAYAGHLQHGSSWCEWTRAWERYPWLASLFEHRRWRLIERWLRSDLVRARRFSDQYRRLIRHTGEDCLVFCRIGKFVEFYGPQRLLTEPIFGLQRTCLRRADYAFTAGFPVWLAGRFLRRALRTGKIVVVVEEVQGVEQDCRLHLPATLLLSSTRSSAGASTSGQTSRSMETKRL